MRILILLLILLLVDIYSYQAIRTLTMDQGRWGRWVPNLAFGVLTLMAYFYILAAAADWSDTWNKNLHIYFRAFVFILFFSKLFMAVFMGIDDLRRVALALFNYASSEPRFSLGRSNFLSRAAVVAGMVPLASLTYGMIRNPYRYKVYRSTVKLPNLPKALDGLRVVQISDIHSGSFTFKDPIRNGIEMINGLKADLVFFTGDIVNSVADEMEPYIDLFSKVESKHGVYSILGNHDYGDYHRWASREAKEDNFRRLTEVHQRMGWDLLLNEHRTLQINDEEIAIIGVENISATRRFQTYGDLAKAHAGTGSSAFKFLLSHDPSHWDAQVTKEYPDISLTLSGHTHGFQFGIEIPGWIKWSPSKYVYKQWAGLYRKGDQHLYVNRGFGVLGYPGRVGILPEVTLLELKSAS